MLGTGTFDCELSIIRDKVKGNTMYKFLKQRLQRRDLFRGTALAALPGLFRGTAFAASPTLKLGPNLYQSIGVKPLINARGTVRISAAASTSTGTLKRLATSQMALVERGPLSALGPARM